MRRLAPLLLLAAAAGCGGSAASTTTATAPGLPHALARTWASRADEIASAAAAGDGCRAQRLAGSLRDDVIASGNRVPAVYRGTLLSTVNRLADEIPCTPPVQTVTAETTAPAPAPGPGPRPHPGPPPRHDHPGKRHHGRGGDG